MFTNHLPPGVSTVRRTLQWSTLAILACAAVLQTAAASTLSIVPSSPVVSVGDMTSVDLNISGLASGTALGTYDITVDFPSNFTFDNVTFGDPVLGDQLAFGGPTFSITEATAGTDSETLLEVSFDSSATLTSMQQSAFTLAVLNFTANSSGSGSLTLSDITLGNQNGNSLSSSVSNASFGAVSSVPEPSTVLPLCGLAALSILMRKRLAARTGK